MWLRPLSTTWQHQTADVMCDHIPPLTSCCICDLSAPPDSLWLLSFYISLFSHMHPAVGRTLNRSAVFLESRSSKLSDSFAFCYRCLSEAGWWMQLLYVCVSVQHSLHVMWKEDDHVWAVFQLWEKRRPTEEEEEEEEEEEVVVRFRLQELVVFLGQSTKVKRRWNLLINVFSQAFAADFIRTTSVNKAAPQRIHFSPEPVFILCKYR